MIHQLILSNGVSWAKNTRLTRFYRREVADSFKKKKRGQKKPIVVQCRYECVRETRGKQVAFESAHNATYRQSGAEALQSTPRTTRLQLHHQAKTAYSSIPYYSMQRQMLMCRLTAVVFQREKERERERRSLDPHGVQCVTSQSFAQ